jgi:hypothetical protein
MSGELFVKGRRPRQVLGFCAVISALCAAFFVSCSKASAGVAASRAKSAGFSAAESAFEESAEDLSRAAGADAERFYERKLVMRASLTVRLDSPEKAEAPVKEALETYGGYIAEFTTYEHSRHYTLKVPAASYEDFLDRLSGLGKILFRSESAEDVTLNYYDLESRLASKQELLKTFQDYLGKAKTIEEIMTVEARIAELQQEIEWTGTRLRNLSHLIDFATIEFSVESTGRSSSGDSLGERLSGLFRSFGGYVSAVALLLTGIVIYGVPSVLILAVLYWLLLGKIGLLRRLFALIRGKQRRV